MPADPAAVVPTLDRLVAEFDGEVEADVQGRPRFSFPLFRLQMEAAHRARGELALEGRTVGDIVYASDDDEATAGRRELEAFDRELLGGEPVDAVEAALTGTADTPAALPPADDLSAYLNDPDRLAVRDERELAVLAQQMRDRAQGRTPR